MQVGSCVTLLWVVGCRRRRRIDIVWGRRSGGTTKHERDAGGATVFTTQQQLVYELRSRRSRSLHVWPVGWIGAPSAHLQVHDGRRECAAGAAESHPQEHGRPDQRHDCLPPRCKPWASSFQLPPPLSHCCSLSACTQCSSSRFIHCCILIFSFFFFFSEMDSEPIFPLVLSLCLFLLVGSWSVRWANIYRGVPSNTDPDPGRCRRTDGKKWRCGRDVVPDQKYCERHMHRGRHRSRKHADGSQAAAAATGGGGGGGGAAASTLLSPRSAAGTGATSASSSGSGAVSSVTTTNVGPIRGSGGGGSTSTTTGGGGGGGAAAATAVSTSGGGSSSCSPFSLTSCLQQRSSSNLAVKTFSSSHSGSPAHHGGSGGGSSPAASSQFGQLPSLSSSPSQGASTLTNKDYR